MREVKLSAKNQIVIARDVRAALGKAGDRLLVVPRGNAVILLRKPQKYAKAIADMGARFRAEYSLRTPDAIQAATALNGGASGFVSNDPAFRRIEGLEVTILDDLL